MNVIQPLKHLLLCSLLLPSLSVASQHIFLKSYPDRAQAYVIYNYSGKSFWFEKVLGKDPGAAAGFSSQLMPKHFSIVVVANHDLTLSCNQIVPGKSTALDCGKLVRVMPLNSWQTQPLSQGNYWLVESIS